MALKLSVAWVTASIHKMPASIQRRLFDSYLGVLLLGMILAFALAWWSVGSLYLETQRENLLAQAQLTAAALQGQPIPAVPVEPYLQMMNAQPGIHTRLLGEQGGVIIGLPLVGGDAPLQAPSAENNTLIPPKELLARPEIAQAMQGQSAAAIRRVPAAQNRRILYAAAPVFSANGSLTGVIYLATPLPAAGLPASLLLDLAGAAVVAVLLALLAGRFLARRIAQPVEEIAHAANAVIRGDLTRSVPTSSRIKELDGLGQSFNTMIESLRQSDQAKNAFIADVTHELRSPLTVIKGTIETLEDGALEDIGGRGSLLASMQRETDRLIRLVNDLLVLTRANAGTLNLHLLPLDLGELVRDRCNYFSTLAAHRNGQFSLKVVQSNPPPCVLGDSDRLVQVLDNLLDNALRYSPQGATITVEVRRNGEECQCLVQDCGPGISEQHLPFIFERFYRADPSRNRQTGGVGLGLAIAHALILAQGGQISAQSQQGFGTTLTFSLPAVENCHPIA